MATPYNEQELPVLTRLWLEGAIPSWFDEVPRKYKAYFLKWAYESSLWGDEFLGFGEVDADEAMVAMDRHSVEVGGWSEVESSPASQSTTVPTPDKQEPKQGEVASKSVPEPTPLEPLPDPTIEPLPVLNVPPTTETADASDSGLEVARPSLSFRKGDFRFVPHKDEKLNATAYTNNMGEDLGLCRYVFKNRDCPHGIGCHWRHHQVTDAELRNPEFMRIGVGRILRFYKPPSVMVTLWDRDAPVEE